MLDLKWDAKKRFLLEKSFFNKNSICGFGTSCIYIQLSKKIAAKLYFDKSNRDTSQRRQKNSEKYGIAPQTGDKFNFRTMVIRAESEMKAPMLAEVFKAPVYGYLTEVADTNIKVDKQELDNLKKILDSMKLSTSDLRDDNLGRIQGRLVLVDFDFYTHYNLDNEWN